MNTTRSMYSVAALALIIVLCGGGYILLAPDNGAAGPPPPAANGQDNGHAHADEEDLEPISVTLFTPKLQLFMEYPHLVRGESARFLAHLTVLATGEPVRAGTLTFEAVPRDGEPIRLTLDAPKRDGLFVPEWAPEAAGEYSLRLLIDGPQVQGAIDVGALRVHADDHAAEHAAEAAAEAELPDLVSFLLEQQWKIGTLYEEVGRRTLVHRLMIPGRIVAPQGASAAVSPPVAGRLLRPPGGRLPRIGDTVEAGQILAMLEPPLPMTEMLQLNANRAQIQALEVELALRELDLDAKALEVDRSIIQAEARLEFARRAMRRADRLQAKGVGSEQQHDEAERNVRLAEAEHGAAKAMMQSYEDARRRLGELRATALSVEDGKNPEPVSRQMPLRAPIAGKIVSVVHIEGEHLDDAHEEIFRIVNTDRVWVSADISEFDLDKLAENPGASMTLPAYPGRRFDILGSGGGRLVNIGTLVAPETRTVSVVYEMPNPEELFRVGMFADVHLETKQASDAVAIPEKAIVLANGRPTAYVLIDGENFQKRELELGVRDNGWVEVKGGLGKGERVVTRGAYAIKLASLSPASFGHGHGH